MADHQGHAGGARSSNDLVAFIDGRRDRLFDQNMNLARDAGQRHIAMQMRWRRDGHRIGTGIQHFFKGREGRAANDLHRTRAMRRKRIDNTYELYTRQTGQYASMVCAHDARAHHADAQHAALISGILCRHRRTHLLKSLKIRARVARPIASPTS